MKKNIGVILELTDKTLKDANLGMITLARQADTQLFALVLDPGAGSLEEILSAYGICKIIDIRLPEDGVNNPDTRAKALISAIETFQLTGVFALSNAFGKDLLPRVAALMDAPLVMDCFDVDLRQGHAKTAQYSGKALATLALTGSVLFFGIRPNAVVPVKAKVLAIETIPFDAGAIVSTHLKVLKTGQSDMGTKINLAEAEVILSGGRGMKKSGNFELLFQCAQKMGAAVGASRVAVDEGWVPYAMQVGQTGEKVSPRVYIACGISGSIQHFAGMKTSGMVIAINPDENAAIMNACDYFAVADALEILPELITALEKERA